MTNPEIEFEQRYVDRAYEGLERMRGHAEQVVAAAASRYLAPPGPRRDALMRSGLQRSKDLDIGDEVLVFGRVDPVEGSERYIGRIAVYDETYEPLVTDWRAPVAESFYRATPLEPMGLVRRRHLICRGSRVRQIEDELLDASHASDRDLVFVGEGALLDALQRSRTGRMRDIVETIQAEQDAVIRAPLEGALVVQGGPGTGKTAVALHRAAYLLYSHRERLQRAGVLVIGPNPIFLRYIAQVLPSLGETATLATLSELVGDVSVTAKETSDVARVKGDVRMAKVIERAVKKLPGALTEPVTIRYEGKDVVLTVAEAARLVRFARERVRTKHNARRRVLARLTAEYLWEKWSKRERQWVDIMGTVEGLRHFEQDVLADPVFRRLLDTLWPAMSSSDFVRYLFSSQDVLATAAGNLLSVEEQHSLLRSATAGLTESDVALVDEAEGHLGPLHARKRAPAPTIDEEDRFMVERMLDDLQEFRPEVGTMREILTERYAAERAAVEEDGDVVSNAIRERFGHVIVDEAQGLSPMQWRMVVRRCPSRSMTIVGDLGQAGGTTVPASWDEALAGLGAPRLELAELTVNYRTPAEIMDIAARVLAVAAPGLSPPRSVRHIEEEPVFQRVGDGELVGAVVGAAQAERGRVPDGKVAVISADPMAEQLARELVGDAHRGSSMLDEPVGVFTLDEVRGLEFDSVVVVEPAAIVEESSGGLGALYVALTRSTQRLVVIHASDLPAPLTG